MAHPENANHLPPTPWPTLLLGVGLGGFIDGIVLHQILQWHHLVSHVEGLSPETVEGLRVNTLADGAFHLFSWSCVVAGAALSVLAWRQRRMATSWRFHIGLALVGWGVFNLVEGIVNHHVLGIHHVRDDLDAPLSWDLGFLAVSALLVVVGWLLYRGGRWASGGTSGGPPDRSGTRLQ